MFQFNEKAFLYFIIQEKWLGYGLDDRGSFPEKGSNSSLCHYFVKTGSGLHTPRYLMCARNSFLRGKSDRAWSRPLISRHTRNEGKQVTCVVHNHTTAHTNLLFLLITGLKKSSVTFVTVLFFDGDLYTDPTLHTPFNIWWHYAVRCLTYLFLAGLSSTWSLYAFKSKNMFAPT
jgi:hypothetical protein